MSSSCAYTRSLGDFPFIKLLKGLNSPEMATKPGFKLLLPFFVSRYLWCGTSRLSWTLKFQASVGGLQQEEKTVCGCVYQQIVRTLHAEIVCSVTSRDGQVISSRIENRKKGRGGTSV